MCNNPVRFVNIQAKTYEKYKKYGSVKSYMDGIKVPCGNCLGCRLDKLALWSARCNYELVKGSNSFVTFTYDDWHLPYNDGSLFPTLRQQDLHRFIDNIRHKIRALPVLPDHCRKDFSFFASGEYGDKFQRPHYHVLFFGLDFVECKKFFHSSWKFGMIKSLPLRPGGVRYVVDYFTKNLVTGDLAEKLYDCRGLERPFKSVSRGIGSELFFAHRDEIRNGKDLKIGSRVVPVPIYYKNLYSRFSDDEIFSRCNLNREHFYQIVKESSRLGFKNPDDYIKYISESNESSLARRLFDRGSPVFETYKEVEQSVDTQILAYSSLN